MAARSAAPDAATFLVLLLRPPSPASHLCFSLPFLSFSPSLPRRRWARGDGAPAGGAPARAGLGSRSLSPILRAGSSTPPPARELVLLCSRNPRYLCGGGGEARRLDLTVTHPLLLLLRPMSSSPDPLSLVFFWISRSSQQFLWQLRAAVSNAFPNLYLYKYIAGTDTSYVPTGLHLTDFIPFNIVFSITH